MEAMTNRKINVFLIYHRVFNKNNTTGATSGVVTAYYSSLSLANGFVLLNI
jgi:hypothetical protein